jgi:hypothetical protein
MNFKVDFKKWLLEVMSQGGMVDEPPMPHEEGIRGAFPSYSDEEKPPIFKNKKIKSKLSCPNQK